MVKRPSLDIGQDVMIERFVTPEAIRLGVAGLAAGLIAGLAWRMAGRVRWGPAPPVIAVLAAAAVTGRSDWPHWEPMVAAGAVGTILAGLGAACLLADPAIHWAWVAAGAIVSAVGVWAGVPETGPALLAGGAIIGLAGSAALTRARWAPAAGVGVAVVLGWAASNGAAGRPWATLGGTLCTGIAPWFAIRQLVPTPWRGRSPGSWLLGAHLVLTILAARWIGVAPHGHWQRVAVVVAAGLAVALVTRRRA
jgi:hypothetical protein